MTKEEVIEMVKSAFEAWELEFSIGDESLESEFGIGDDWSKEHEARDMAIKALEQQDALDKIRAEIETARFVDKDTKLCKNANASGLEVAMQIIDKYEAEESDKK